MGVISETRTKLTVCFALLLSHRPFGSSSTSSFRAAQHLAITAIELGTAAFVLLSVATTVCWLDKPADVQVPDYITTRTSIEEILLKAGDQAASPFNNTPLDFVSRTEWSWSILWAHGLSYLQKCNVPGITAERPINRFHNTTVPFISNRTYTALAFVTLAYFAIFVAAWNFTFPTKIEQTLWRAASMTSFFNVFCMIFIMHFFFSWLPQVQRKLTSIIARVEDDKQSSCEQAIEHGRLPNSRMKLLNAFFLLIRSESIRRDPALDAPMVGILATWFIGGTYCLARLYILVAELMELRSLPRSAYQGVDWAMYWPHF